MPAKTHNPAVDSSARAPKHLVSVGLSAEQIDQLVSLLQSALVGDLAGGGSVTTPAEALALWQQQRDGFVAEHRREYPSDGDAFARERFAQNEAWAGALAALIAAREETQGAA